MSDDKPILVGTRDAALIINKDVRTVRKYIDAGKLTGHKVGNAWFIEFPRDQVEAAGIEIPEVNEVVGEGGEGPLLAPARSVSGPEEDPAPPAAVDLAPIAAVIADLTRQVASLSESTAMWQERARILEAQNQEIRHALTAGERKIDEAEAQRRAEEAAAAAREQGRAEALAEIDRRPWWQKLFG